MESLQLPHDMIWDGKVEPSSPLPFSSATSPVLLGNADEYWTIDDTVLINDLLIEEVEEEEEIDQHFDEDDKGHLAQDLLIELIDLKTEQWLNEENIDLSLMMREMESQSFPTTIPISFVQQQQQQLPPVKAETPLNLYASDFADISTFASASDLTHLTPPQTPPQSPPYYKNSVPNGKASTFMVPQFPHADLQLHRETEVYVGNAITANGTQPPPLTQAIDNSILYTSAGGDEFPNSYNCPEIDLVDELLKNKMKEIVSDGWAMTDNGSMDSIPMGSAFTVENVDSNQSSPRSESSSFSASSPSSSYGPDSSANSCQDDEEWLPTDSALLDLDSSFMKKADKAGQQQSSKRRSYNRGSGDNHVDKKSRKKEQNKNAATRYRKKKKQEIEELEDLERGLKKVNRKLKTQHGDKVRELKYLKNLLRELYKGKGILL